MGKVEKIQEIKVADLKPYERNAKIHSREQVQKIADSIQEFGFISPCLIDSELNIIAGHGRVEASKLLGLEVVPCMFVEGLTEEQKKAYILADNKLTEMGEWDMGLVSSELEELAGKGFDIAVTGFAIDNIQFDEFEEDPESEIELKQEYGKKVHQGEIWQLGKHRLMCGDSTKIDDVNKLMNGEMADLFLTDPPYNVAIENSQGMTIENDDLSDMEFIRFLEDAFYNASSNMKDGASFYVWYASCKEREFINALEINRLLMHEQLIWVKSSFKMGRQDYHWRHEPCIYGWKDGASHYFIDLRSQNTIFEKKLNDASREELIELIKEISSFTTAIYEDKPSADTIHPTMKPLGIIKKQVRNSSKENWIVLDLFGGSGTTLIACEELNRRCYMMEYDERYASSIIERWEDITGEKAVKL